MQFRTAGKETLDLKIMKEKILGILVIIKNKLEIKKIRENSEFPIYILSILMRSSRLTRFHWKEDVPLFMKMYSLQ